MAYPGEKECISTQYIIVNTWISHEFLRILPYSTTPNHFQYNQKQKLEQSTSILWLLSFNVPEYHPLQAYFYVKTPASLIL